MQIDRSTGAGKRLMPAAVALLMVVTASQAWADLRAGAEAYQRGDYATALTEFRSLAQQGNALAQLNLGVMYSKGLGVPQDYVQAHMWVNLAAAQGDENARKARDKLAEKMPPAQITEARRLAREWKPNSDEPGSTKAKEAQGDD